MDFFSYKLIFKIKIHCCSGSLDGPKHLREAWNHGGPWRCNLPAEEMKLSSRLHAHLPVFTRLCALSPVLPWKWAWTIFTLRYKGPKHNLHVNIFFRSHFSWHIWKYSVMICKAEVRIWSLITLYTFLQLYTLIWLPIREEAFMFCYYVHFRHCSKTLELGKTTDHAILEPCFTFLQSSCQWVQQSASQQLVIKYLLWARCWANALLLPTITVSRRRQRERRRNFYFCWKWLSIN